MSKVLVIASCLVTGQCMKERKVTKSKGKEILSPPVKKLHNPKRVGTPKPAQSRQFSVSSPRYGMPTFWDLFNDEPIDKVLLKTTSYYVKMNVQSTEQ